MVFLDIDATDRSKLIKFARRKCDYFRHQPDGIQSSVMSTLDLSCVGPYIKLAFEIPIF